MQTPLEHSKWTEIQSLLSMGSRPKSNLSHLRHHLILIGLRSRQKLKPSRTPTPGLVRTVSGIVSCACPQFVTHKIAKVGRESCRNLKSYLPAVAAKVQKDRTKHELASSGSKLNHSPVDSVGRGVLIFQMREFWFWEQNDEGNRRKERRESTRLDRWLCQ